MLNKFINSKDNIIIKLDKLYDKFNNKLTISTSMLSFLTAMIGFYIVHAAYFVERHVNEDFHYTVRDGIDVFFTGARPLIGRFFGGFITYFNSWTVCFICAIILSLASLFIIKMFDIKDKISVILISLSVISFPSLACTYGYLFIAQNYTISILCAVLAAFFTAKFKYGFLIGSIFLMISLAEYQAYIALTMALLLISIYIYLNKCVNIKKDFFVYIGKCLAMGILGVSLYFIILKWYLHKNALTLSEYGGANTMGQVNLADLPYLIMSAYKSFIKFYDGETFFYLPVLIKIFYIIIALITFYLIYNNIKGKNLTTKFFVILLIIAFPLCLTIMEIAAPDTNVDTITSYAFVVCMISPLILSEFPKTKVIKTIIGILITSIIINNYLANSRYYLFVDVVYEQTFAFENRLYSRIEETEGFEYGIPIAIIADNRTEILSTNYNNNTDFPELKGERGFFKKYIGLSEDFLKNTMKTVNLFRNMLGADVTYASQEQIDAIMKTDEFEQLTVYPAQGSIKVIDGIMTVNFIDHERLSSDNNVNIETNANTINITHNYHTEEVETAWYIHTEDDVIKMWYTDSNALNYSFDKDGSYSITLFVRDKLDKTDGDAITACSFDVIDGQIQNIEQ